MAEKKSSKVLIEDFKVWAVCSGLDTSLSDKSLVDFYFHSATTRFAWAAFYEAYHRGLADRVEAGPETSIKVDFSSLATAMRKFAPDLADELVKRWVSKASILDNFVDYLNNYREPKT